MYVKDAKTNEKVYNFVMQEGDPQTKLFETRTKPLFAANKIQREKLLKKRQIQRERLMKKREES